MPALGISGVGAAPRAGRMPAVSSGGIVGKKPLIIVVIVLLAAVVGFLAMDRQDKVVSQERDKAFDAQFAK